MMVLVIRGSIEEALAAAKRKLGDGLEIHAITTTGRETIVHMDTPLGHDVHRWLNEHSDLVWFNMVD